MRKTDDIVMKMRTQEVYLRNHIEECLIRRTPDGRYFCKFPGRAEYQIYKKVHHDLDDEEYSTYEDRDIISDALMIHEEVTREEYYNY